MTTEELIALVQPLMPDREFPARFAKYDGSHVAAWWREAAEKLANRLAEVEAIDQRLSSCQLNMSEERSDALTLLESLQDDDMPKDSLASMVNYMIDHSNEGWMHVGQLMQEASELKQRLAEVEKQRNEWQEQFLVCSRQLADSERRCKMWRAKDQDGAWHYQGDGTDFPESLVCPVVMTANQLRSVLAQLEAAEKMRAVLNDDPTEHCAAPQCDWCNGWSVRRQESISAYDAAKKVTP